MDANSRAQLVGFAVFFLLVGIRWWIIRWRRRRRIDKAIAQYFAGPSRFREIDYGFRNPTEPTILKQKPTDEGAPIE